MTKMRICLAVSVVLNIFLLGAVSGGAAWVNFGHKMILAGSLRVAGAELAADQRRAFRTALRQARASVADRAAAARDARGRAADLLRQPQVDQNALNATLDEARSAEFAVRTSIEKRAVEFVSTLPPDSRAHLADAIDERAAKAARRGR
jgi:uncharacterized membrane protein